MANIFEALLNPRSVAIIGASSDKNKLNGRPQYFMQRDGFEGKIYPVNPKYDNINGLVCYPDIGSLPEAPDLAIVIVGATQVVKVITKLGEHGVKAAIIFSSGFAEIGDEGRAREVKLVEVAQASGIRILGPNNLGVINSFICMPATFSQYADIPPHAGPIAFASQSGAFGTGIAALARSRGLGIGYFVNTGNEADVTVIEALSYAIEDKRISVACAYLEGVREGDQLAALADKSIRMGKPFIVTKVGRNESGARAAASHTGALAVEDTVFDGVIRQRGAIRARNELEMVDLASAFVHCDIPKGRGIGLVTQSGGAGVLMADRAEEKGLHVPEMMGATRKKLLEVIPSFGATGNPIDVTGQFLADPKILFDSVCIVLDDPQVDIGIIWLQLMHGYADLLIDVFKKIKTTVTKPFLVCWLEPPVKALIDLSEAGICVIQGTEQIVDAAAGLVMFGEAKVRITESISPLEFEPAFPKLLGKPIPSIEAWQRLKECGLPLIDCTLAVDEKTAVESAQLLGFPVALKIESPDILHKMDIGGVMLDLNDTSAVIKARQTVLDNAAKHAPSAEIHGVLIQKMARSRTEFILGVRRDLIFGSILMLGLGGVFVEVLKDVAFAQVPVSRSDAEMMLGQLVGKAVLEGIRGQGAVDKQSLIDTLCMLSDFAKKNPDVVELEMNPVLVGQNGVLAVDWLVMSTSRRK